MHSFVANAYFYPNKFRDDFDNSDDFEDNDSINADDINVDEYLSDDEIPDYRMQANNYSVDDEEKSIPYASGTSFTQHLKNQINTYRLNEKEEIITKLGIKAEALIRKGEDEFKTNYKGKILSDSEWIEAMIKFPKLIERPIVINEIKAVIDNSIVPSSLSSSTMRVILKTL